MEYSSYVCLVFLTHIFIVFFSGYTHAYDEAKTISGQNLSPLASLAPPAPPYEEVIDTTKIGDNEREYNIYPKHNEAAPCDRSLDTYNYQKTWYDETQIYLNSRLCEPALWFDDFFSNDRVYADGVPGTYVRWRNDFIYDEEDKFKFKMGISASLVLPGLQDRLRLTFASEDDEDLRDIATGNKEDTSNSLGLQLDLFKNLNTKFNVSVSLRPRVRFRYRVEYPVDKKMNLRLTQEVQQEENIASAKTIFDIEHSFLEWLIFRSSTEAIISEAFDGYDWVQAFGLLQRVNKKASLSYETSVSGISQPRFMVTNNRIAVRYKQNFHRRWLFYEVSPEITWPVTFDARRMFIEKERHSKWQLLFRLEVHFGNSYKKLYQDHN